MVRTVENLKREYKFRGIVDDRTTTNIKWLYSIGFKYEDVEYKDTNISQLVPIIAGHVIRPNTLGQYTSFKDINNKYIYDGDIVKDKWGDIGIISFKDGCFGVEYTYGDFVYLTDAIEDQLEVIGNKFENKDLLNIYEDRPVGVWCYDKNTNELIKPENWTSNNVSGGVVVVTDNHAFRVLPHYNVALEWGVANKKVKLCQNIDTISGEALTDKIIEVNKNIENTSKSHKKYSFIGSPAAEFCKSVGGYLPSVVELQAMAEHIEEINKCMQIMKQPTLPIGWYWSSVEHNSSYAWYVDLNDSLANFDNKDCSFYVHAVSEFDILN